MLSARRKRAGLRRPFEWMMVSVLEGEPCPELTRERPRQGAARGVDETERVPKAGKPDRAAEVIAVVGMVRKVESLEHELQVPVLTQLEVLSHACVHVEVRITTQSKDGV